MNKPILDVCCGARMFWFDKTNPAAVFVDKRRESFIFKDKSSKNGLRSLIIAPDIQANFTALPFQDESFSLVIFDPPHLNHNGLNGWLAKKYGRLKGNWQEELRKGFSECFRVLKNEGTLIFKWSECEIPLSSILALTPVKPLIGQRSGKSSHTHWIVFMKTSIK